VRGRAVWDPDGRGVRNLPPLPVLPARATDTSAWCACEVADIGGQGDLVLVVAIGHDDRVSNAAVVAVAHNFPGVLFNCFRAGVITAASHIRGHIYIFIHHHAGAIPQCVHAWLVGDGWLTAPGPNVAAVGPRRRRTGQPGSAEEWFSHVLLIC
jgi:hypothetical protein